MEDSTLSDFVLFRFAFIAVRYLFIHSGSVDQLI